MNGVTSRSLAPAPAPPEPKQAHPQPLPSTELMSLIRGATFLGTATGRHCTAGRAECGAIPR